jgi:hypothetical protein
MMGLAGLAPQRGGKLGELGELGANPHVGAHVWQQFWEESVMGHLGQACI